MFAHDLCDSQIEYLRNSIDFKGKTAQHAAPAPVLRERLPQIFNFQYSIVNSGLSGLGIGV